MKYMNRRILLFVLTGLFGLKINAQEQKVDTSVKEIILVFKTHFDIGYTDYAEAVVQKYSSTMMQNALDIVEKNKTLPAEKQFVWTVSGWPMEQMLQRSNSSIKSKVAQSLKNGRFAVHALPFSMETEYLLLCKQECRFAPAKRCEDVRCTQSFLDIANLTQECWCALFAYRL
jgi:alpha-mannosidase